MATRESAMFFCGSLRTSIFIPCRKSMEILGPASNLASWCHVVVVARFWNTKRMLTYASSWHMFLHASALALRTPPVLPCFQLLLSGICLVVGWGQQTIILHKYYNVSQPIIFLQVFSVGMRVCRCRITLHCTKETDPNDSRPCCGWFPLV